MKKKLIAIITGDIVDSRKVKPNIWLKSLKKVLRKKGSTPGKWEIFRGDMFQLETTPEESLLTAIEIKAELKQVNNIDVRIAIGIGLEEYKSKNISESNGEAFTNSGQCFENLKKQRLAIKAPWLDFDEEWNLYFRLASLIVDDWTSIEAQTVSEAMARSELNQKELAKRLKKTQSTISATLNRAGYDEIKSMMERFEQQIKKHKAIK